MTRVKQVGVALFGAALLAVGAPAFADDSELLEIGEEVFEANCGTFLTSMNFYDVFCAAACHAGGQNSVVAERTLAKAAIAEGLGGFTEANIENQVSTI